MKNSTEWSLNFDLLFNNITSNRAPGLSLYEKSAFLTQGELALVKDVFTAKANALHEGIDDSTRRQSDFRTLITNAVLNTATPTHQFSTKTSTKYYTYPKEAFLVLNEELEVSGRSYTVVPISHEEYARLMKKPYKYPPKGIVWRLITDNEKIELIANFPTTATLSYHMRYVKRPGPIILENLQNGLTIDGVSTETPCELPEHIHDEILRYGVQLAKIAWESAVAPVGQAANRE